MNEINVKEILGTETNLITNFNERVNDSFIKESPLNTDEAYARLKLLRKTFKELEYSIDLIGTGGMPSNLVEKYESLKFAFRTIEKAELDIIKGE